MGENEIDPVGFGRLIESVQGLKEVIKELSETVKDLDTRIKELEGKKNVALGILIGIGSIGGAIGAFVHRLLGLH